MNFFSMVNPVHWTQLDRTVAVDHITGVTGAMRRRIGDSLNIWAWIHHRGSVWIWSGQIADMLYL